MLYFFCVTINGMNYLITGGAGFIGSHMCTALIKQGHHVVCIDNLSLGSVQNIDHIINNNHFTFVQGDILDKSLFESLFVKSTIDCIIHLAANSDIQAGSENVAVDIDKTFLTTVACLSCIKKFNIKQFVFASSSAVYGDSVQPLSETTNHYFPVSFYGAAKLAAEHYIHAMLAQVDCKAWVIRFPNVVGDRLTHGVVYDFIHKLIKDPKELKILGDGKQKKPYVMVDDLIDAIFLVVNTMQKAFNVVNVGVQSATTVTSIADIVTQQMNLSNVSYAYTGGTGGWVGDVAQFSYDLSLIKSLGWQARYTSDQAITESVRRQLTHMKKIK